MVARACSVRLLGALVLAFAGPLCVWARGPATSTAPAAVERGPAFAASREWSVRPGHQAEARGAFVEGGNLYLGGGGAEGRVAKLDIASGEVLWSVPAESYQPSYPVSNGKVVVYGTYYKPELIALDDRTGAVIWSMAATTVMGAARFDGDVVYIATYGGKLHAIEWATGKVRWVVQVGGGVWSRPLVVGDELYVGSTDGNLYMLGRAKGEVRRKLAVGGSVRGEPAVAGGLALLVLEQPGKSDLLVLDLKTGQAMLRLQSDGSDPRILVDGNDAFLYDASRLVRYDIAARKVAWEHKAEEGVLPYPVLLGERIVLPMNRPGREGQHKGRLITLSRQTGQALWRGEGGIAAMSPHYVQWNDRLIVLPHITTCYRIGAPAPPRPDAAAQRLATTRLSDKARAAYAELEPWAAHVVFVFEPVGPAGSWWRRVDLRPRGGSSRAEDAQITPEQARAVLAALAAEGFFDEAQRVNFWEAVHPPQPHYAVEVFALAPGRRVAWSGHWLWGPDMLRKLRAVRAALQTDARGDGPAVMDRLLERLEPEARDWEAGRGFAYGQPPRPENRQIPAELREEAEAVRAVLPKGWSLEAWGNDLVVRRDELVSVSVMDDAAIAASVNVGAGGAAPPPGTIHVPQRPLPQAPYVIALKFAPRLSFEQFERIWQRHRAAEQRLDELASTLDAFRLKGRPVPRTIGEQQRLNEYLRAEHTAARPRLPDGFSLRHSVYVSPMAGPRWVKINVEPEAVKGECDAVEVKLRRLFDAAPLSAAASAAAQSLKANLATFELDMVRHRPAGEAAQAFDSLRLRVTEVKDQRQFGWPASQISQDQAAQLIDVLARTGLIERAVVEREKLRRASKPPYYAIEVRAGGESCACDLGWGLPMLRQLEAFRDALNPPMGIDKLLDQLAPLRQQWEKEAPATRPAAAPAGRVVLVTHGSFFSFAPAGGRV